ncbi:MAG: hypothetical protein AAB630_03625 [Patescibacteria group bacterium]
MNKVEIAETMLRDLREGRVDDLGTICEAFIACRKHVEEDRARDTPPSMYTLEEANIAISGGELAQEVLDLLQKEDLDGIKTVLMAYEPQKGY